MSSYLTISDNLNIELFLLSKNDVIKYANGSKNNFPNISVLNIEYLFSKLNLYRLIFFEKLKNCLSNIQLVFEFIQDMFWANFVSLSSNSSIFLSKIRFTDVETIMNK